MQFGIKKGSVKEITLNDIAELLRAKLEKINASCKEQKPNNTELFIEVCYELAEKNNFIAALHLDHAFTVNDKMALESDRLLAVKFTKNKY